MSKHTGLLFMGFVVVAAIAVIVFVQNNNTDTTATTNANTVNSVNSNLAVHPVDDVETVSADGTFTLLKPAEKTVVGEIVTYRFSDGNSLSIMPEALKSAVLNETPIKSQAEITVSDLPGTRYTLSSAKDGSLFTVVQVIDGSQLYDFRGSDDYLSQLDSYITFTK